MSSKTDSLQELKNLLESKTVISVKESPLDESICEITLDDTTKFTLFATDMGFWTLVKKRKNEKYTSMSELMCDCALYASKIAYDEEQPWLTIENNVLRIEAGEHIFEGDITKFTPEEQEICNHFNHEHLILSSLECGPFWLTAVKHMIEEI